MEKLEDSLRFRQEIETEYFELRGYPKTCRNLRTIRLRRMSEERSVQLMKAHNPEAEIENNENEEDRNYALELELIERDLLKEEEKTEVKSILENKVGDEQSEEEDFENKCSIFLS